MTFNSRLELLPLVATIRINKEICILLRLFPARYCKVDLTGDLIIGCENMESLPSGAVGPCPQVSDGLRTSRNEGDRFRLSNSSIIASLPPVSHCSRTVGSYSSPEVNGLGGKDR